jgi:hypothetical protein
VLRQCRAGVLEAEQVPGPACQRDPRAAFDRKPVAVHDEPNIICRAVIAGVATRADDVITRTGRHDQKR